MTDLPIAAPLAAALAAKGYESLTPVQEAVLAPELLGRDALVSAQTGSGKTVAFGLAMAPEVLGGADILKPAEAPLALIIAPTRELAQQVARELEWLYAEAGAQIATCVGGMDYRTERRALSFGAHIVVGTPGRLRDHIERGSLDMSLLHVAVLDEADEMLDLGFAEDLEFILSAAPEGRRTLMFSATVPKEIEKLASTFQRDAIRLQTAGEAKQHGDIEYRAFNVSPRDREHAIFNVLRYYEARTAIVFCKTRANVNHLLARMGNRGFQVVALSGELSQTERMHALQALRDGRARVCIATDVAARGIDLPGLELVIHADLPSNSETLLHRSGRTGRAGNKGVSALIVPPSEFRKASRLLQGAKVVAEWAKAPSADEVQERDDARLMELPLLSDRPGEEAALARDLIERYGAEHMAAAFVRLWRDARSAPEVLQDMAPPAAAAPSAPRDRNAFGEAEWFLLTVGHEGRAEARWLLPKICDGVGITKNEIGAIRVQQTVTFVQIAKAAAGRIGAQVELEPGLNMERVEGEPQFGRPERGGPRPERAPRPDRGDRTDRAPRRDKPAYQPKPSRFVDEGEAAPRPAREDRPARDRDERPARAWEDRRPAAAEGTRKPYASREREYPQRPEGAETEKRSYKPREAAPYGRKAQGEEAAPARKPYTPRDSGDRKPYAPREAGERKPYAPRDGADRKPYTPREGGERKPYGARDTGDRKPYTPREGGDHKPYGARDEGDRKPYAPRGAGPEGGDRKPRWSAGDRATKGGDAKPAGKSAGFKSHGGGKDKPARAAGTKSHKAEGGFAAKSGKGKPAPRPVDARDTSKRFVPPKKK